VIITGDCLDALRAMPSESVDAVVTDPPYGLGRPPPAADVLRAWLDGETYRATGGGFMGASWDAFVPGPEVWREVARVLKPGGHAVIFAGSRTLDWMGMSVRLGGLEIRDTLGWVYWSGFPKSMDVSKAIDAAAGAQGSRGPMKRGGERLARLKDGKRDGEGRWGDESGRDPFTYLPATDAARRWSGWGTALKPAIEPVILARKPFQGTVAANVQRHGTGAIHIDGCRLAPGDLAWPGPGGSGQYAGGSGSWGGEQDGAGYGKLWSGVSVASDLGRWPANLYACPKAPRSERERGCDGLPARSGADAVQREEGSAGMQSPRAGAGRKREEVRNHHPTVKPIRLMRWLCRLVTPPGGLVVDPFAGSGSTGVAAALEGFAFVGCELDSGHVAIAEARIGHAKTSPGEWADTAPGGKRKKAAKMAKVRKVKVKAVSHPTLFGW
jgi:DNA modification methylase